MQVPAFIQKLASKVKPWNQKQFGDKFAFAYCISGEVVFPVSGYCSLSFRLRYPEELEGHGFYLPLLRTVPGILEVRPENRNGAVTYFSSAPLFTGVVEPVIRPDDVKKVFVEPLCPNSDCAYYGGKISDLLQNIDYRTPVTRQDTVKMREINPSALHVEEIFTSAKKCVTEGLYGFFDAKILSDSIELFQSMFKNSQQARNYDVQLQASEGPNGRPEIIRVTFYSAMLLNDELDRGSILLAGIRSKNA